MRDRDTIDAELRLLANLRRSLHHPPTQLPQGNSATQTETGVAPTDSAAIVGNHKRKQAEPTSGLFYTAPGTPPFLPRHRYRLIRSALKRWL
jgi:hypothetical protein